ncbi:hypothetical protein LJR255_001471 [Pararhizobium sp. LjRoot255]|uniref:hypothetical protein n=1 Tax=Pararhizobium sp. LjRoot255 TaxID=3342298 RepID=UPI003ECF5CA6
MDLQGCRLVAGCLADDDGLDEITHDRHEPLSRGVVLVAGFKRQGIHDDLDGLWTELFLKLGKPFRDVVRC